ncbi:alpha/beta hydrolase [Algisphaera agarilytica]|uniref:Acetyl esterase/lipase n=1 Tax=Algisphaera agarilytica TaxID=1385975 RepID=A0A7X0LL61_9BACT|nr:alpha/beta hydrolase [Algisphaera agarilytica]MBB6431175.1 acetyl esterase/lipase [Algisphaera agarilytica]
MSLIRIPLWHRESARPDLTLYPTESAEPRGAVMVCPGGGYQVLSDHEGWDVAERLAEAGFDAAVLRYRLGPHNHHPAMLHDAQRGLRLMRQRPEIRAEKIAVLGFSAGGHLASSLAVHAERWASDKDDLAGEVSARPDAAVLCYPVIDMAGAHTHEGSRNALLGEDADPAVAEMMSTHLQVNADTPPTFLWHTADDEPVPMQNSLMFATACREAGVPVELHVYESGVHGLGLAPGHPAGAWFDACTAFLDRQFPSQSFTTPS